MNNFFTFSPSPIFLLFNVSMTVSMAQYISFPLSFRNPPAIFWRFFAFLIWIMFTHIVIKWNCKIVQKQKMVFSVFFHPLQIMLFLRSLHICDGYFYSLHSLFGSVPYIFFRILIMPLPMKTAFFVPYSFLLTAPPSFGTMGFLLLPYFFSNISTDGHCILHALSRNGIMPFHGHG